VDLDERNRRAEELQDNTAAAYQLLMDGALEPEQARAAVDLLQLQADLIDLSETLARKRQTF
jgi:hypothetical protein